MERFNVTSEAVKAMDSFSLPKDLGFGKVMCPIMMVCDYDRGEWGPIDVVPYGPLTMDPTCKVLHYGQEIFEGMKAYFVDQNGPFLFRPKSNFERFNYSAERMAMPAIPEDIFMGAVNKMVESCAHLIPGNSGDSLYLRPFMFASENHLGIKPPEQFRFMVIASPSSAYFSSGTIKLMIERERSRACQGGIGRAKTGGNYAASLLSTKIAHSKGLQQVLWLDAESKSRIEELSGMNFFAVIDNILVTPSINDSILNGITRHSIIQVAWHRGLKVEERDMHIDELLDAIQEKRCVEAFACGTAVIVTPIESLVEIDGRQYPLPQTEGEISMSLRRQLLNIQEGREKDPFGWRVELQPRPLTQ